MWLRCFFLGTRARKEVGSASKNTDSEPIEFTQEELTLFTQRLEEGYDLTHDARYNAWLEYFHSAHGTLICKPIICICRVVCLEVYCLCLSMSSK